MSTLISSAIVLSSITQGVGAFGFRNLFEDGSVTASSENTGFEKENAYDWKQYDWWKPNTGDAWIQVTLPTSEEADYFSVWGHNLSTIGAEVKAQYSYDGTTWYETEAVAPGNNTTIFVPFAKVTAKYYRIYISTSGQAIIGGVMVGKVTWLEQDVISGFTPPLIENVESKTAMSESGINLGASIVRSGIDGSIALSNLSYDWVRTEWVELAEHLNKGYPCVFCWDTARYKDDSALIWKSGNIPKPANQSSQYMSVSLNYDGVL